MICTYDSSNVLIKLMKNGVPLGPASLNQPEVKCHITKIRNLKLKMDTKTCTVCLKMLNLYHGKVYKNKK